MLLLELVLLPCLGGALIALTSAIRRGFPSWAFRRRDAEGRLQVRVAALGCSPQLQKQVMVMLSCGYGKTSWEIPCPFMCWSLGQAPWRASRRGAATWSAVRKLVGRKKRLFRPPVPMLGVGGKPLTSLLAKAN